MASIGGETLHGWPNRSEEDENRESTVIGSPEMMRPEQEATPPKVAEAFSQVNRGILAEKILIDQNGLPRHESVERLMKDLNLSEDERERVWDLLEADADRISAMKRQLEAGQAAQNREAAIPSQINELRQEIAEEPQGERLSRPSINDTMSGYPEMPGENSAETFIDPQKLNQVREKFRQLHPDESSYRYRADASTVEKLFDEFGLSQAERDLFWEQENLEFRGAVSGFEDSRKTEANANLTKREIPTERDRLERIAGSWPAITQEEINRGRKEMERKKRPGGIIGRLKRWLNG